MKKLFLDSNIWLRFFLKDNDQFESTQKLISAIEEGKFKPYASAIVLLEVTYVLKSVYKLPAEKIIKILDSICDLRNITIIEKTNSKIALKFMENFNIKYSDCLIASQIKKDIILVTFDREFSKIKSVNCKTPAQILAD
ncbi:MAG: PIN domain-containing protein [bacterium]|nr:PIN domain-containing protein [bacterium]